MNSLTCEKCQGCQHRKDIKDQWCYMFEYAPRMLPCGQHNKFKPERDKMAKLAKTNPKEFKKVIEKIVREYKFLS